jgi:MFS family permease
VTAAVSTLDRFAMAPMLVAIAADLDVPLAQVVHAAGAYFLAYGLMQPVRGLFPDRLGLVRTLRLTLLLGSHHHGELGAGRFGASADRAARPSRRCRGGHAIPVGGHG